MKCAPKTSNPFGPGLQSRFVGSIVVVVVVVVVAVVVVIVVVVIIVVVSFRACFFV
jgi:hypothetical protein